jgi:hypothetical protein
MHSLAKVLDLLPHLAELSHDRGTTGPWRLQARPSLKLLADFLCSTGDGLSGVMQSRCVKIPDGNPEVV